MLVVGSWWRKTVFMRNRSKHGLCWYCDACHVGSYASRAAQSLASIGDRVVEKVISSVSQYFEAFKVSVSDRLTALETGIGPVVTPPLFLDIFKEVLDERAGPNKGETAGIEVNAFGKTKLFFLSRFLLLDSKMKFMLIRLHQIRLRANGSEINPCR